MQPTCALRRWHAGLVRAPGCARSGLADQLGATDESAISSITESANASARNGFSTYPSAPATSAWARSIGRASAVIRSEEHTSELQSRLHLVCRLLLENKTVNR